MTNVAIDIEQRRAEREQRAKRSIAAVAADPEAAEGTQLAAVIRLILRAGRVLLDDNGTAFFHPPGAVAVPLASSKFRDIVAGLSQMAGMTIKASVCKDAVFNLRGAALAANAPCAVRVRVAGGPEAMYLHLGSDEVVTITKTGWDVASWKGLKAPPALFVEPNGYLGLVRPERGGSVHELRNLLNVSDSAFALVVMWLVAAMRPAKVYPILAFVGPKGSAKSTSTRIIRDLVDCNVTAHRAIPRKEGDLAIAAQHGHVQSFDNLSGIGNDLSDALCRMATGGGFGKRTLYSDGDETTFQISKPIILNGIDELGERADLGSRTYLARLEIPRVRKTEAEIASIFATAAPRVLGALLDALVVALRDVESVPTPDCRMADAAQWALACEGSLGFPEGTFATALEENAMALEEVALEASPVAEAVEQFAAGLASPWEGTSTELDGLLRMGRPGEMHMSPDGWPRGVRAFGLALRRILGDLRIARVEEISIGRGSERRRGLRVRRRDAEESPLGSSGP